MLKVGYEEGEPAVIADQYKLKIDRDNLLAYLTLKEGDIYYHMCLLSACDQIDKTDASKGIKDITVEQFSEEEIIIRIEDRSSLWKRKTYYYKCSESHIEYYYEIEGEGVIDRVYYFRGSLRGFELGSVPGFDLVFNSCPNFLEKNYFHASDFTTINAGNDFSCWGQALSCAPFCFSFNNDFKSKWLSVGLAPEKGEYIFQSYDYNFKPPQVRAVHDSIVGTQSLSLSYYGKKTINGRWETPHLVFHLSKDKYNSLKKYVDFMYAQGHVDKKTSKTYHWWKGPIFCGWHEQVARAMSKRRTTENFNKEFLEGAKEVKDYCQQELYEKWLDTLNRNHIKPGIIIIDAQWQVFNGDSKVDRCKWPDLRGFIDNCHKNGQRVLLWLNAWDSEGVPDEECIKDKKRGKVVGVDPTNPAYVKRLKKRIKEMLSSEPGCYNADGFKIDGTLSLSFGYSLENYGNIWGLELQKRYMTIFYTEAKKHKQDALINLYIANPYFYDLCDMVRVGDMYTVKGNPLDSMIHRGKIIKIAMPDILIDTDGEFRFHLNEDWVEIMKEQAIQGIPTIYQAETIYQQRTFNLPKIRKISSAEYKFIAQTWQRYIRKNRNKNN